jgi:glycosyltransferase involved in cell wall biosynthesis
VQSALDQNPPPLEVLVCDDGSSDETQAELERWQRRDTRVRYLRMEANRGTPAPARNAGIASARGEWVAFLDDDDRWLAGKLARQMPVLADPRTDVVASDAIRSNGARYFGPNSVPPSPTRNELERSNTIILSTAMVRRHLLRQVQGFDEQRRIAGVEDYELWLRLADRGAHFSVLDVATVAYADHGTTRLSSATVRTQRALLRMRLRRWLRAPGDRLLLRSVLREVALTARMMLCAMAPSQ